MLDYLDDLHADFLAIWGIDVHRDVTLTGPEFFAMARRTFCFDGVMAARARLEDQQAEAVQPQVPQRQTAPASQRADEKVVDLATFRQMFPGVVSHSTS